MRIDIDHLSESELIDLNHRIIERLHFLSQMRAHAQMLEFKIGDRVSFDPDGRPTITGMLTRYNRKSVTIITDDGQRWNVSPHLIRKAQPNKSDRLGVIALPRE
jgi:hypothetical protein